VETHGAKACGGCDLCCRLYDIEELAKPAHSVCVHARPEGGCAVHGVHPKTCQVFQCMWLARDDLDALWRPSTAGFVLRGEGTSLYVDVDPERRGAWKREPYYAQIKAWSEAVREGRGLITVEDHGIFVVFPERDIYLGRLPAGALIEAGYLRTSVGVRPWARLARPATAAA
jgi:uncharacterized cysteine cluster protein YcgN (CxxCxxCC family)